ncbi:ROK family transcriptional regulator [Rhizobium mongolense]|uniref:NBD/HSP70 family sugar kinase n=2 Tax=Rhizobium mongolense TaxID=57676 RepID=A0ABR6IJE0_9HYPH|nr:ROK family transcriptional regulator [Rhizobium mongolense]MBB4227996.1 putative NBD/HSP70 family sugar kinase [Rhizobium mongolense]TVZ64852.1 putative NBD/HSP70 family sugar kinase [Rhizobium mongolense USDA 1844]
MVDQTVAKYLNELRILTMLRTQGPASRADIARWLGVTPATITRLINSLIDRDLAEESKTAGKTPDGQREPGRPGGRVSLNPSGAFFLGVEIGVGIIRFAVIDLMANVVDSTEITVSRTLSPSEAVAAIADHLNALKKQKLFKSKIMSVGVTVPGIVTSDGFVINLPILGWKSVDLRAELSSAITLPCFVENNANAAAFGAVYTQPSLPSICTIFLKLGTGCGGAAVVNGRPLRGANGTAGEFGHIRLSDQGALCSCGQRGCLESWVNLGALARNYMDTDKLTESQFAALPAEVVHEADAGNAKAIVALESFSHWMGLGIVSLINMFNPSTVILGGVMRPVLEHTIDQIRSAVEAGIISGIPVPDVRLSELGKFECAIGAATIAHHHAFDISRVEMHEHELQL